MLLCCARLCCVELCCVMCCVPADSLSGSSRALASKKPQPQVNLRQGLHPCCLRFPGSALKLPLTPLPLTYHPSPPLRDQEAARAISPFSPPFLSSLHPPGHTTPTETRNLANAPTYPLTPGHLLSRCLTQGTPPHRPHRVPWWPRGCSTGCLSGSGPAQGPALCHRSQDKPK